MLSERPNPIDLPDDAPDAACINCLEFYSAERAKELEGECPICGDTLEPLE